MTAEKVNDLLLLHQKNIDSSMWIYYKTALKDADDSKYAALSCVELLNPTRTVLMSIFLGWLGVDRFYVGDIGLGVCKLLFGWLTGWIWQIVDIFCCYKKAKAKNLQKLMLELS